MTRVPTTPVSQREPVLRDRKYLDSAWSHSCDVEGCPNTETVIFAHMRVGNEGGMGLKPPDWCGAWLCHSHHMEQEANPGYDWWARCVLKTLMKRRYEEWKS